MPPRRRKAVPRSAGALSDLPPLWIVKRILLLQLAYYVSIVTLILFTTLVFGKPFSLDLVWDWRSVRGDTTFGWTVAIVWGLGGFVCVIPLIVLVTRSKLVPDFALTIHFLHLLATSIYTRSLPTNLLWWVLQAASSALMIGLGVWACRYREMRPINFGGSGTATGDKNAKTTKGSAAGDGTDGGGQGDEEQGFTRGGRGRGRDRGGGGGGDDGGGSYEMVGMKDTGG